MANTRTLLVAGFMIGLLIRLLLLKYKGTPDMDIQRVWGENVDRLGLADGFTGNYYPFMLEIFGWGVGLARQFDVAWAVVIKSELLVADAASFAILVFLLRVWDFSPLYALFYWLHPFFIVTFCLGYVDTFLVVMVLAMLAMLARSHSLKGSMLAGIPLAAAVAMKPQGLIIAALIAVLGLVSGVMERGVGTITRHCAALLAAPVGLFLAYCAYFTVEGRRPLFLATLYVKTPGQEPALTGDMLNLWYPIAHAVRQPHQQIWAVNGSVVLHAGMLAVFGAITLVVMSVIARRLRSARFSILVLWSITAGIALFPMIMTEARENHFFIAATLLTLLLPFVRSRWYFAALTVLLLILAVNLFSLYGFGENELSAGSLARLFTRNYSLDNQLAAAWLAITSFVLVAIAGASALVASRGTWKVARSEPSTA